MQASCIFRCLTCADELVKCVTHIAKLITYLARAIQCHFRDYAAAVSKQTSAPLSLSWQPCTRKQFRTHFLTRTRAHTQTRWQAQYIHNFLSVMAYLHRYFWVSGRIACSSTSWELQASGNASANFNRNSTRTPHWGSDVGKRQTEAWEEFAVSDESSSLTKPSIIAAEINEAH